MEMARANKRSCRRCHRDLTVCRCGGARRSAHAQPRRDPDAGGDRISALHDDLLLRILARVGCAHSAARTGVLSRRWRGLWTRLPELALRGMTPGSLDAMLARVVAVFDPQARAHPLSLLDIRLPWDCPLSLAQISSLLDAAASLQPTTLVVHVTAVQHGLIQLPRLDHTKSISLAIWGGIVILNTPQDQEGGMPNLESLTLHRYNVFLGALLHRFSALRSLSIPDLNVGAITINLPLLQELFLIASVKLQHVVIMAPSLKKLTFHAKGCVADNFTLSYSAPEMEDLSWKCSHDASRRAYFGDMWILRIVNIKTSEPLGQLQQSPPSNTLSLDTMEWELLCINSRGINSRGHIYGAMVLHLLEVYTMIERLKVDLRKYQVPLQLILMEPNKQPEAT